MRMRLVVIWCFMAVLAELGHGSSDQSPEAVEKWFKDLPHAKQKVSKLHFYFHDIIMSKHPTAVQVAQATGCKSIVDFGAIYVIDDPLTTSPDPSSKLIGRAQGVYGSVCQAELVFMLGMNLVFTDGEFNGSTLSILGSDPVFHEYREMPIMGGSGAFRLATGIATAKTFSLDETEVNAVVEYDVVVLHY